MEKIDRIGSLLKVAIVIMLSLSFMQCEDIVEDDLSTLKVLLVSPSDSIETTIVSQTFIWERLKDVISYRLEIASPSFDRAEQMLVYLELDTTIYKTTLFPGEFEWRVIAINGSSTSQDNKRSLTIVSTDDISDQIVITTNPANELITSEAKTLFAWNKLYNADSYDVKIKSVVSGNILFPNLTTPNDTMTKVIPEGKYEWSVRGFNETTETYSRYSQTNLLTVDKTAPSQPVLKAPLRWSSQIDRNITFQWNKPSDNLTLVTDSLIISTDSLSWSNPIIAVKTAIDKSNYTHQFVNSGKYYWRVKSIDQAGNQGAYSAYFSFTITQ